MAAYKPHINDPFYSFNRFMLKTGDQSKTQLGQDYLNENKDAAFNRHLAAIGIGQNDTSPFAEFARKQQANAILGHKTAMAENPQLGFTAYLSPLNKARLQQMFARLSDRQRGERKAQFVGPVRTIGDM